MLLNAVNLTKLESFVIKQRNQKEILGFLKSIQASDPKALVIVLAIFVYLVNKSFHSNMITINILFMLHLIVINKFVTSQQSELSECNPNLYTQSSCIDMNKTYRCKCNPGFIWNGKSCVSTALDSYFEFQEKSTSSYIFYEKTFPKLKAFTLSTWLQIYDHLNLNDNKTLFTYSIETE
ncbi:cadherin EGF LAG seven-pass G-type receptor 1-like isoform X1 [Brachionus plicatilis]|uniref:Cadherin EGF LAG seven-pass G-type receptor 1-like isoform X1 n=1 Tax=Brachionus plicatilis TaxID=10195 RepID=A0A3M7S3N9_BRAPC|nr:cadherin EGF LAG seven-pass G-type receptor 1-like isoform X1 [Brachionus plicatilis]